MGSHSALERLNRTERLSGRELITVAQGIFRECALADAVMRRYRDGWIGRVRVGTTLLAGLENVEKSADVTEGGQVVSPNGNNR